MHLAFTTKIALQILFKHPLYWKITIGKIIKDVMSIYQLFVRSYYSYFHIKNNFSDSSLIYFNFWNSQWLLETRNDFFYSIYLSPYYDFLNSRNFCAFEIMITTVKSCNHENLYSPPPSESAYRNIPVTIE